MWLAQNSRRSARHSLLLPNHCQRLSPDTSTWCVHTPHTSFKALLRGPAPVGEWTRLFRMSIGGYFAKKMCTTSNKVTTTDLRLTANRLNMFIWINYMCGVLRRHVRVDGR